MSFGKMFFKIFSQLCKKSISYMPTTFFLAHKEKKNIFITFHEKWFMSWGQVDDHLGYNMKSANPHTTRKALSFVFTEVLLRQMCANF